MRHTLEGAHPCLERARVGVGVLDMEAGYDTLSGARDNRHVLDPVATCETHVSLPAVGHELCTRSSAASNDLPSKSSKTRSLVDLWRSRAIRTIGDN